MEALRTYLVSVVIILAILASIVAILLIGNKRPDLKKKVLDTIFSKKTVFGIILALIAVWAWKSIPSDFTWGVSLIDLERYLQSPSFTTTGEFVWKHWLGLLILFAATYLLIEYLVSEEKRRKPLRLCLTSLALLLFVIASIIGLAESSSSSLSAGGKSIGSQKVGCVIPFSSELLEKHPVYGPDGGYTARDKWLPLKISPGSNSCRVENPRGGHIEWDADTPSIHDLVVSCVYEGGGTGSVRTDSCKNGAVTAGYVHNPTNAPVTVWYAYAENPKPSI